MQTVGVAVDVKVEISEPNDLTELDLDVEARHEAVCMLNVCTYSWMLRKHACVYLCLHAGINVSTRAMVDAIAYIFACIPAVLYIPQFSFLLVLEPKGCGGALDGNSHTGNVQTFFL